VHTVVVTGRIVKQNGRLVGVDLAGVRREIENTVEYLRGELGDDAWAAGMYPDQAATERLENPYQYTDFKSETTTVARADALREELGNQA
jgi:hypothetical protein